MNKKLVIYLGQAKHCVKTGAGDCQNLTIFLAILNLTYNQKYMAFLKWSWRDSRAASCSAEGNNSYFEWVTHSVCRIFKFTIWAFRVASPITIKWLLVYYFTVKLYTLEFSPLNEA